MKALLRGLDTWHVSVRFDGWDRTTQRYFDVGASVVGADWLDVVRVVIDKIASITTEAGFDVTAHHGELVSAMWVDIHGGVVTFYTATVGP